MSSRTLRVFLCHSSNDKPAVYELYERLSSYLWIEPWIDERKLLLGQDWRIKIEEAIESSDAVIICLSNNFLTKEGYAQKELRYIQEIAMEKTDEAIFLIPIRLNDCTVPKKLRSYQWGNYFGNDKEKCFSNLISSLNLRYEQISNFVLPHDINLTEISDILINPTRESYIKTISTFRKVMNKKGFTKINLVTTEIEPQGITPFLFDESKSELIIDPTHVAINVLAGFSENVFLKH